MPVPRRPAGPPPEVVVVGASLAGLFAAAAAAEAGCTVTLVERDRLPATPGPRRGVPQGRQAHVLLHRGLLDAEHLVPGLEQAMVEAGAVRVDTGGLPWFGPYGWQPTWIRSYDILSMTRPRLEQLIRERVLARPEVTLRDGVTVEGLRRDGDRWLLLGVTDPPLRADLVVDASGRGSRLPHWLADLGCSVPEPEVVDAHLGYAGQLHRRRSGPPLPTGLVVQPTPEVPRGAIGLPVEDGGWMFGVNGYGEHRPGRSTDVSAFLAALRDPAMAEVIAGLEPVGEIAVNRQTANRRYPYGRAEDWPRGLLVVGDALCAFNPIFGQGMTVAALQARLLEQALRVRGPVRSRRLQRRLGAVAELPWRVATGEDRHYLPAPGRLPLGQRLGDAWITQVGLLLLEGHPRAARTFGGVYHLMTPLTALVHPALVVAVAGRVLRRRAPAQLPRPPVVDELIGDRTDPGGPDGHSAAGATAPPSARTVSSVSTSSGPLSGR